MGFPQEPLPPEEKPATYQVVVPQETVSVPWDYQPHWDPIEQEMKSRAERTAWVKRVGKRFGALSSLSLFAYLTIAVVIFLLMGPEILRQLYGTYDYLFVITPEIVPILRIDGALLVGVFALEAVAITASFFYITGRSVLPTLREAIDGKPGKHSTMLTIGGLFFLSYLAIFVSYLIVGAAGVTPNTPDFGSDPIWAQIYSASSATVWEELIARVLLLGVPLLWIDLIFRRKALLPPRKYLLGGINRFGTVEVGLVIFSAAMFATGHVWNWDIYKVIPTAIGGLCFGYLFVKIGLHASIIFHVCFNFLSFPTLFTSASQTGLIDIMMLFVWLPAGVVFFVYYFIRMIKFLRGDREKNGAAESRTAG
jgi:hypothetical protein